MDFVRSGRTVALICAIVAFAASWAGAVSSFGTMGLLAGWLPAAVLALGAAGLAWLAWAVVALSMVLGWHCHARERGEVFG